MRIFDDFNHLVTHQIYLMTPCADQFNFIHTGPDREPQVGKHSLKSITEGTSESLFYFSVKSRSKFFSV